MRLLPPSRDKSATDGFVLIPVLFGTLLLLSLVSLALTRAQAWARAGVTSSQGEGLLAKTSERLAKNTDSFVGCSSFFVSSSAPLVEWLACSEPPSALQTYPPVALPHGTLDVDEVFRGIHTCPGEVLPNQRAHFDAPAHPFDCTLSGDLLDHLVTLENIRFNELRNRNPKRETTRVIASVGEIRGDAALVTNSDLLLVAGGNVFLSSLLASDSTRVKVTIIAVQGSIEVAHVDPTVSLLMVGPRKLLAPPMSANSPYPMPDFRPAMIRGAVARSRLP
jgi:hypothetical protein